MALKAPISIFCRIKPGLGVGDEPQEYRICRGLEKETLSITSKQTQNMFNHRPISYNFQFSHVFDQSATQESVYESVAKPIVHGALKGFNGTIFAYGQTGSGKTFTISGDKENPGIVPRALHDVYSAINNVNGEKVDVKISYLEIYNEHSNDLLVPVNEEKKKICLRENTDKMLAWHNLSLCTASTLDEALELLSIGDDNRIVGDTPMNVFSSRSHTILTIYLTSRLEDSLEIRKAKLNLVDLAGSERVHKTGEEGIILEEARHINLSLHYLEQVIVALSDPARIHVPFRNCTLTSALRDSLGGNCKTVMVANITVGKANLEETMSTCRFAQRVALVRNELVLNIERDLSRENSELRMELEDLRGKYNLLQAKLQDFEIHNNSDEYPLMRDKPIDSFQLPAGNLSVHQLKTDIIFLIDLLQYELKSKAGSMDPNNNESLFFRNNVFNTAKQDEGFDSFMAEVNSKEDWLQAQEVEHKALADVALKVDVINAVHQDILNWWKQNEKLLVKNMLSGCTINTPSSESTTDLTDTALDPSSSGPTLSIETLLNNHSDLLKDFQLLKSRLQSSKRNLQRIKRKYLLEYNNWQKVEQLSSDNLSDKIEPLELPSLWLNYEEREKLCCFREVLNNSPRKSEINSVDQQFVKLESKNSFMNYSNNSCWNVNDLKSDRSLLLNESQLSSALGELNDSVFSTSTLLSFSRFASEKKTVTEPRLARSEPTALDSSTSHTRSPYTCTTRCMKELERPLSHGDKLPSSCIQLTGDLDVDDEIINFYKNKHLN